MMHQQMQYIQQRGQMPVTSQPMGGQPGHPGQGGPANYQQQQQMMYGGYNPNMAFPPGIFRVEEKFPKENKQQKLF